MTKKNYIDDIIARQAYTGQDMPKKDPFDQGIMRAIKSSKESLAMDEEQEDRALRNSMLSFGDAIGQMPRAKGFLANLAQAGRALSPALKTHDAYEDQARDINRRELGQAQKFRAAEDARAAQLEQSAYAREMADRQRDFQERQLAELKDFHNQSKESARLKAEEKAKEKEEKNPIKIIHGKPYHKMDLVESRGAEKLRTGVGNTKLAYDKAKEAYSEYEKKTRNNTNRSLGGFLTRFSNPIKEQIGLATGNQSLKDEAALRNSFKAQLGNVTVMLEVAKTNKALTQGMYDRLKGNFPDTDRDSLETIFSKMKFLTEEVDLYDKAARLSSEYGVKINPADAEEFEAHIKANTPSDDVKNVRINNVGTAAKAGFLQMRTPSGVIIPVAADKVQDAIDEGLVQVD